jgi:hypothetical protein
MSCERTCGMRITWYNSDVADNPRTIKITKGYSKDHRPDLNQFVVSLLCAGGNVAFHPRKVAMGYHRNLKELAINR